MYWREILIGALLVSAYSAVKIIREYAWDTHLVFILVTWLVAGPLIVRSYKHAKRNQAKK